MPVHARTRSTTNPPDANMPWTSGWRRHLFAGTVGPQTIPDTSRRCDQLLADVAARLTTVDPGSIEDAIADGLRRIAEYLQLDRVVLCRPDQPHTPSEALALAASPRMASRLNRGQAAWFARLDEVSDTGALDALQQRGVQSAAVLPVPGTGAESREHEFVFAASMLEREWEPAVIEQLSLVAGLVGLALARRTEHDARRRAVDEVRQLREHAAGDDSARRPGIVVRGPKQDVRASPAIRATLAQVEQVAPTNATVLLLGETGVGKEVLAQAIHDLSPRRHRPMITVSCAAIPAALIESELFGRERGAYTGAITRQIGRFEAAHQSTLFLDEIGDLPADVQAKLLRVLQERVVERLGSTRSTKIDVRIIAATNRNLEKAVQDNAFREDLFYRLNVFPVTVPPLRERLQDIPGLVWEFIAEFSSSFGKPIESIASESMRDLQAYGWPGNVRELRNVIERAVILASGRELTVPLRQFGAREAAKPMTLATFEADHIRATLKSTNWRIRGAGGAAERLGLKPTTLESRMAKLGIVRPPR
jgi:formate hydrogenlyase transcriptional activator